MNTFNNLICGFLGSFAALNKLIWSESNSEAVFLSKFLFTLICFVYQFQIGLCIYREKEPTFVLLLLYSISFIVLILAQVSAIKINEEDVVKLEVGKFWHLINVIFIVALFRVFSA